VTAEDGRYVSPCDCDECADWERERNLRDRMVWKPGDVRVVETDQERERRLERTNVDPDPRTGGSTWKPER
jgi:hypothetical protein